MKKIISLLLTLILIVCLTACGKLSAEGQKVSAMLTGQDSKTVKLTLKGEILGGADKDVSIPTDAGGATFAKAEITKDAEKKTVIQFTGLEPGGGIVTVSCKKGSEDICQISFMLSYFETGKFSFGALQINEGEFVDFETSGDNKEEASENVLVPDMDSEDSNLLYLKNPDGEWTIGEYTAAVIEPTYLGDSEDGFSKFLILPVTAGEGEVQFINTALKKQTIAKYEVTEIAADGEKSYTTKLKDFFFKDYTWEEHYAAKDPENEAKINKMQLLVPGFGVPKNFLIEGFSMYNFKSVDQDKNTAQAFFRFEEGKPLEEITLPDNIDTISMDLEYDDSTFVYEVTKARTVNDICKSIDALKATELSEDITIGDKTVKYYHTTYGFGQAVWEHDGFVYNLTFTSKKQTSEDNKKLLNAFVQ